MLVHLPLTPRVSGSIPGLSITFEYYLLDLSKGFSPDSQLFVPPQNL